MTIVHALNAAGVKTPPAHRQPRAPLPQPALSAPRVLQAQRVPAQLSFSFVKRG